MTKHLCMMMVIERDDAVLIPGHGISCMDMGFTNVTVVLEDGVTFEDINTDKVAMFENKDKEVIFKKATPDEWEAKYAEWEASGLLLVGFEAVRYYPTYEEYLKAEEE